MKDVNEYVQVGQEVEVKILEVDEASKKIKLSMKATQEAPKREKSAKPARRGGQRRNEASNFKQEEAPGFTVLKDKLEDWIKNTNFKK